MAYQVAADIKSYLGINGSGDDELLTTLIAQAQRTIEASTGRVFEAGGDALRRFDYDRHILEDEDGARRLLVLDGADLCAITSVVNGDGTTVASTEYVTEPRHAPPYWGLRLKRGSGVAWTYTDTPENAIAVTGKWAYSLLPPDDVKMATRDLAVWLYRRRGQEGTALEPVMSGSGVIMFPPKLPETVKLVIARYQRVGLP